MKTNSSPARNRAKSPFIKGATLLAALLLASSVQVKADTITNYDLVDDVVGNSSIGATPSNYGLGLKLAETIYYGSGSISGEFTAWDTVGNSPNTDLYFSSKNSANLITSGYVGTATLLEKQFSFTRSVNATVSGVYASGNGSNPFIKRRNFRIYSQLSSASFATVGPSALSYANISDNTTYTAIPASANGVAEFRGQVTFATDAFALRPPVQSVYLSLERVSDGAYWNGREWGHLRVNHQASLGAAIPSSSSTYSWSTSTKWPTGGDLSNGFYRLRTMAVQNTPAGTDDIVRGSLNTITFQISSTPTYYRLRNRWASSMYMYDGGDIARYNTLQSPVFSQSPASFEWELLPVSTLPGYLSIKNHATGDILHVENVTGVVQCTSVPYFYTSSMWLPSDVSGGFKRFENQRQIGKSFRLGYTDGKVHYDAVPANDVTAHWGLELVSGNNIAANSTSVTSQPSLSGGES